METVKGEVTAPGGVTGRAAVFVINHNADNALATLRYRLKDAQIEVAEEPFEAAGQKFNRGSFIIANVSAGGSRARRRPSSGLNAVALAARAVGEDASGARGRASRCMHTWLNTQDEGWWRQAFDHAGVPYTYISTQDVAKDAEPAREVRRDPLPAGRPRGRPGDRQRHADVRQPDAVEDDGADAEPRQRWTQTDDMRPGLGWAGLAQPAEVRPRRRRADHRRRHARTSPSQFGFTPGVSIDARAAAEDHRRVLRSKLVDDDQPDRLRLRRRTCRSTSSDGPIFGVSNIVGGAADARRGADETRDRADRPRHARRSRSAAGTSAVGAGAGGAARRAVAGGADPEEQLRNGINVIPPAQRPRVVLRYGDARDLLVSGLLDGGAEIAQRPMVVDVPRRQGPRRAVLEQPDLARRDAGQLLPGVQRDPELRQPGRGAETGCEIGYPFIARLTARRSTSASKGFCRNGAPVSSRRWSTVTCPV